MRELNFSLDPMPPFRLDLTAWALRRRPVNTIDSWDGEAYSRVLVIEDPPVFVRIIHVGARNNLKRWLNIQGALNYEAVNQAIARWRPYSGLLYFHLLLDGLTKSGILRSELVSEQASLSRD